MKDIFKPIVVFILAFLARAVVRRYRPRVVMITGSVGKTSTKDAVAAALAPNFFLRKSEKSFNSEFGVPFTILDARNPWRNPLAWMGVMKSAVGLLLLPNHYPNLLVLEVGSEKPGNLAQILKIVVPDIVVVTRLPDISVHVEAYASPEAVQEEEFSPAYALPPGAPLIIPADDTYALDNAMRIGARIISYGDAPNATVSVSDIGFYEEEGKVVGMRASVQVDGEEHSVVVKGSVGKTQLLAVAAALAAAHALHVPLTKALAALENYEPPPGRGRIFAGKNGSVIIDDSYNASPAAVAEALETLKAFPHAKRRIAVLGDMLELGRYSVMEHERIAVSANISADIIVTVGIRARTFSLGAKDSQTMQFDTARSAGLALANVVREGDVILVKGSQSIRTERVVEALLANPSDVSLLVRQEEKWKQKV